MKFLLAILLSFIMTEAPVLAIHGGYTLGSPADVTGTFAGVLIPTADDVIDATDAANVGTNSLGLFTLSVPTTGLGSGAIVIFSNGRTFTGSIQALPNPDPTSSGIIGVLTSSFNYNLFVTVTGSTGLQTVSTEAVTAQAQGSFNATVVNDTDSVGGLGLDLDGTSQISIDQGMVSGTDGVPIVTEQVTFAIEGFQQSTQAAASSGT